MDFGVDPGHGAKIKVIVRVELTSKHQIKRGEEASILFR